MAKRNGTVSGRAESCAPLAPVIDFQFCRWKKIEELLLQKLMDFSREAVSEAAASHAMSQFWGEDGFISSEFDDEASFARFFDWFVFDYRRNTKSRRIIERFYYRLGHALSEEERSLLEGWLDARLGFYEVASVQPGEEVTLVDIFTGRSFRVPERSVSHNLHKYDLIFTRPLKVFGIYSFSVAGLVIPRSWKQYIEAAVRYELARYRRWHPQAGYEEFFRDRAYRINRFLVRVLREREAPSIRTSSGEEFLLSRAWYKVSDGRKVVASLARIPDLKLERLERDDSGVPVSAVWTWFYPLTDGDLPYIGSLILGEVRMERGYLRLQCLSRERLCHGKQMLEVGAGQWLSHRVDDFARPSFRDLLQPSAFVPEKRRRCLPPEMEEAMERFLINYYRRWIDEPVSALGGCSPREACQTEEGRLQVIELLKMIENVEDKKRRAGEPHIEVNSLRRELGLPEED